MKEIYLAVKKKLPRISIGTVYRNLKNLKKGGDIQEIFSEVSRYDGNTSNHGHFICQKCNKVFDVFDGYQNNNFLKNKKIKVGKVNDYQIYFYGKCKKCSKK